MSDKLLNVVIIAKKNTSLRFLRTLDSILNQSYSPIHIIVVDVNEQNSMYSLGLQEDLFLYSEVEYLKLDPSFSNGEVRNYLMDYIDGEYVAFLNDNDSWSPSAAISQIHKLGEDSDGAAACFDGVLIDERKSNANIKALIEESPKDSPIRVYLDSVKMSAQIIYRIAAVRRSGGFDEEFASILDIDMIIRLSKDHKIILNTESLCECRITTYKRDYEWQLYLDYKRFKIKYLELFIPNRVFSQAYYGKMIKLAIVDYMWLDLLIYIVMYFVKSPLRTIKLLLRKGSSLLRDIIMGIYRELSIIKERIRVRISIFNKAKEDYDKSNQPKHISLSESLKEGVKHLSVGAYYEQSSLEYVFNHKLKNLVIGDHVTIIKKGMFYGCDNLISIEIPNTVIEIQAHAFHRCQNLRYIKFQDESKLTKIGDFAFTGCSSLEKLNLPIGISHIGKYAFAECYNLSILKFGNGSLFPSSIEKIPNYAFAGCKSLESLEFEPKAMLDNIQKGAFLGCSSLQKVILTGRLRSLGSYAFAYCTMASMVAILQIDSLKSIGKSAFMYCESLPYFQLPNDIERVRAYTFYACSSLKYIKIPKKVLSINQQAFRQCPNLNNVLVLTGDVMISPRAFDKHTEITYQETNE